MNDVNITNEVVVKKKVNIVGVFITILALVVMCFCGHTIYKNIDVFDTVQETHDGYYYDCEVTHVSAGSLVLKDEINGFRVCKVRDVSKYEVGQTVRVLTNKEQVTITIKPEIEYQMYTMLESFAALGAALIIWMALVGLTDWAALIHEYEYDKEYSA